MLPAQVPTAPPPAAAPAWWSQRAVLTSAPANDYAPITQGQLKHLATQALQEIEHLLAPLGGAPASLKNAVPAFTQSANYAPVTLGQLKTLARPFHTFLIQIGYSSGFPWDTTLPNNHHSHTAPANIGQAKMLFAFDLPGWFAAFEQKDTHGIPLHIYEALGLTPPGSGTGAGRPPTPPRLISVTINPDRSRTYVWEHPEQDADEYHIYSRIDDGPWKRIYTVPAGTTSVTLPAELFEEP